MIEVKTNPVITISDQDVHTLKVVCDMAEKWMASKYAVEGVGPENQNNLSERIGISVVELSFVKAMLSKIKKA